MQNHNVAPYYDQFDPTNNYLKLLFIGGKALQSSELNQLQSTLQNQISIHGKYIFEDGAVVSGGETNLNSGVKTLKLTTSSDVSVLNVGDTIRGGSSETLAKIIFIDTKDANPTLFVIPTSGNDNFTGSENLEIYSHTTETGTSVACDTEASDFDSTGSLFSISQGFMFFNGYYIHFEPQTVVVSKNTQTQSAIIALQASSEIITYIEDANLVDPANGLPNSGQDGAHRFKTTLTLRTFDVNANITDDITEIARIENNKFINSEKTPILSDLEDTLARRTFDESGNYTVRPFKLSLTDSTIVKNLKSITNLNGVDNISIYQSADDKISVKILRNGSEKGLEVFGAVVEIEFSGNTISNIVNAESTNNLNYSTTLLNFSNEPDPSINNTSWASNGLIVNTETLDEDEINFEISLNDNIDPLHGIRIKTRSINSSDIDDYYMWFGDYLLGSNTVNDKEWRFRLVDRLNDPHFNICLDAGKAYIRGYEFETISKSTILAERARDTLVVQNFGVGITYGNYVLGDELEGWFAVDTLEIITLQDDTHQNSTVVNEIGTAKIRQLISHDGNDYRVYIFDIQMNSGKGFSEVKSIVSNGSTGKINISANSINSNSTTLFDNNINTLVFGINQPNIKTLSPNGVSDITYNTRLKFEGTFNNSVMTLNAGAGRQFLSGNNNTNFLIINETDGSVVTPDSINFGTDPQTITINKSGLADPVKVMANVRINTATQSNKTLVENHEFIINDDTAAFYNNVERRYTLKKSDGYKLKFVKDVNGNNITSRFTFDNGQKDNYYDHASIILNRSSVVNVDEYPITVSFDYFTHSGSGFFSVDSYTTIPYINIPNFISPNTGKILSLRDCIDFRPRREDDSTSVIIEPYVGGAKLPLNNSANILTSDYEFYLPRIDKVVLTKERNFEVIRGISALNPVSPKDSENAMTLYTLTIPPYTSNPKNIKVKYHENKNYTMREIGSLEKRIENLEYYTTLSLLEKETLATDVTDNNGENRFKNGIIVDNFTGHSVGDVGNSDYKCAIDTQNQFLRSPFASRNLKLEVLNSTSLANVGNDELGNFLILPHTTEILSEQPFASKIENVNPFLVVKYIGDLALNPAIDNWVDKTTRPDVIVNLEGSNDAIEFLQQSVNDTDGVGFGTTWNDWETTWTGVETDVTTTVVNEEVIAPEINLTNIVEETETPQVHLFDENNFTGDNRVYFETNVRAVNDLRDPRRGFGDWNDDIRSMRIVGRWRFYRSPNFRGTSRVLETGSYNRTFLNSIGLDNEISSYRLEPNNQPTPTAIVTVPRTVTNTTQTQTQAQTRTGTNTTFSPNTIVENIGTRIVDVSIVPFMRSNDITITGKGLRPNRELYTFFDGINVDEFVTHAGAGTLKTDAFGNVSCVLHLPSGVFRTGDRDVTLIDDRNNNKSAATTYSTQKYTASGLVQTSEDTIISTRNFEVTQEVVTEERTIRETIQVPTPVMENIPNIPEPVFTNDIPIFNIPQFDGRIDPLAQTVFINGDLYPNGVYLSDIDIFFKTKSTSNVPVRIEIRPVVNGYPSSSKIVPMSVVYKNPDDINTSADGSVSTKFEFPVPIYLGASSEYAIVILADSQEYEVYVSELGENDIISGNRISKQPSLGSLFKSQNGATWTATQNEDLKYIFNKCVFDTNVSGSVTYNNQNVDEDFEYSLLKFVSENIEFNQSSANITWEVKTTSSLNVKDIDFTRIENNKNTEYKSTRKVISNDDGSLNFRGSVSTNDIHISPLIDMTRQYAIAVENIINNTSTDELESNGGQALAKYITRRVTLDESLDGNYLKVYLGAYKPDITDIKVYYRVLAAEDNTDFDQRPYTLMTQLTNINTISTGQNDYKELVFIPDENEITYTNDNGAVFNTYKTFSIKVVMNSSNTSVVPRIRDLRVISTAP